MVYRITLASLITPLVLSAACMARADFGETVAATALGSALGSTAGTIIGNVVTSPRPSSRRPIVKEVIYEERVPVDRVHVIEHVRSPKRGKLALLEREASRLIEQIQDLSAKKRSLERRIVAIEQELADTETAIDIRKQSLKNIEAQRRSCAPVHLTKGPEIAEIEVL